MSKDLPLRILIADDDKDDLDYLSFIFQQHKGFDLAGAVKNANEVINFIEGNNLPDILMTDLYMPIMNGSELVTKLLDSGIGQNMSIFIISGVNNETVIEDFKDISNVKFLSKPTRLSEINDLPELILEKLNRKFINRI